MATVIRTAGLTKRFGPLAAVDGLDIDVSEGEVFGFLGPNGAGKTTTLRLLCALIAPSAGTAEVAGLRLGRDDARIRASVGILTEHPGLYERLTAAENLLFFASLYGLDRATAERQVVRFLDLMGLAAERDRPVATFSRGMKQKMAIARAALHEPPVLFLDEPTTGLDPDAARTVRDLILSLAREGRTVFLCTHNLDEADRLCDRIAFFQHRVLRIDEPDRLRAELYGRTVEFRVLPRPLPVHLERLCAVAGVREAWLENGSIVVRTDDPLRTDPACVRELVAAGADVAFVSERRASLEDLYLRIVHEQQDEDEVRPR